MDMDWYRRPELKRRAKDSLKHNYWKCIVVGLLLFLLLPCGSILNNMTNSYNSNSYNSNSYNNNSYNNNSYNNRTSQIISTYRTLSTYPQEYIYSALKGIYFVPILVFFFLLIYLLTIPVLRVGCCNFFLENSKRGNAEIRQVFHPFKNNFLTTALTMFLKNLFLFFWTLGVLYVIILFLNSPLTLLLALPSLLLLVLPIMKYYEYRMIPYILADRPDLKQKEVFEQTKLLMKEQKMRLFLLDLSFLGWNILSSLTLHIAGYFYVNPYRYATEAEFYLDLKREWEERLSS